MSKSCFLFGHSDSPHSILPFIERAAEIEITNGTKIFYVGYHGNFDHLAAAALRKMKQKYPKIILILLLAYHPSILPIDIPPDFDETFYPPLETVPPRYALVRSNQYMIKTVNSIICYAAHIGNARSLLNQALKRQKTSEITITNLADSFLRTE